MNIALIVGCARSGTSILGELIASHPEVKYIFEAHHIWEIAGLGENESHCLLKEHATPDVKRVCSPLHRPHDARLSPTTTKKTFCYRVSNTDAV